MSDPRDLKDSTPDEIDALFKAIDQFNQEWEDELAMLKALAADEPPIDEEDTKPIIKGGAE